MLLQKTRAATRLCQTNYPSFLFLLCAVFVDRSFVRSPACSCVCSLMRPCLCSFVCWFVCSLAPSLLLFVSLVSLVVSFAVITSISLSVPFIRSIIDFGIANVPLDRFFWQVERRQFALVEWLVWFRIVLATDSISEAELGELVRQGVGAAPTKQELRAMMCEVDSGGSGTASAQLATAPVQAPTAAATASWCWCQCQQRDRCQEIHWRP